ncbi:type IV pilin protein [Candidatus Ruminimicrobiellum ovillum]|uniref:type IV pilin protein n=1 Tax=Candidatus Ruminimicrobiellum ovillum TaxID=1947927 RepID=UPI003559CD04
MIKIKGFTLPEVVITIAIVGILALAAVPVYRGYVRKSMATEGKALLAEINAAEQVYYSRNGHFYATSNANGEGNTTVLGIDARSNKYFTAYKITTADDDKFTAVIESGGADKSLTLNGSLADEPKIIDNFSNKE